VPHQVVLQKLRLIRRELEFDISSDTGIDAVDPIAARDLCLERRAAFGDQRTRARGKLHHAAEACRLFYILNGERMCAYNERSSNRHARLFYREGGFIFVGLIADVIARREYDRIFSRTNVFLQAEIHRPGHVSLGIKGNALL